tara:strand:+ start:8862 stop:9542 length:681 start_codon:yes stop_codon:yes gene_type:complete
MYNKLYHGDALKIMAEFKDNSIDLIITDPPYSVADGGAGMYKKRNNNNVMKLAQENIVFEQIPKFKNYINILYRILKNNAHAYIMINNSNLKHFLEEIEKSKFELCQILIWEKSTKIFNPYFMLNHEFILLLRKGYKNINNYKYSSVIKIPIKKKHHLTEKPIRLMEIFIEASSKENNIILDPFMGSGTTGVGAKRNNRKFIGIEIDKKYFDIAEKRINEYQGILI